MKFDFRQRLLATTLISAAFVASPAWAQADDQANQENSVSAVADTSNAPTEANSLEGDEAIVITGSRIPRRDLTSSSPLTVIQDEEFKLSGAINVEQVINTLPQVIPGTTSFSNNPGGGVATLNLRGLDSARTLVLVNGRRYVFFDVNQLVDLNTIPQFLLDSVDVVTGGASAVYGSDAIAGVVNFRLRNDLNGLEAGGQVSLTERGDGRRMNTYLALGSGFNDDRGRVTVFGEYFDRKPVFQGQRRRSELALGDGCIAPGSTDSGNGAGTTVSVPRGTTCQGRGGVPGLIRLGSAVVPEGRFLFFGDAEPGGNFGDAFFSERGTSRPTAGDTYNYAPANYLQVPQERFLLGGYGEYEISNAVTAFTEVSFINNRVQNELAPTPVTGNFNFLVEQQRPFLSGADFAALQQTDANETALNAANGDPDDPGVVNLFVLRRPLEAGSRNSFDERNAFRVLGGLKGPAFGNFNYEGYYFYARTRNANVQLGNISRSAFQAGLDGSAAPINIFGPGTLTPGSIQQISILAQNNDISTLQVGNVSLAGTLGNLGMGAEDFGIAVGAEYRKVASRFIPDTALSSGDVIGFNGGDPTQGSYNVRELFAELRVPLIADRPFFHRLELTGAYRYSDYSLRAVGSAHTYAGGVEFAPVRDLTFRGQYQRAVRAPNVGELFGGQSNGFPAAVDPCSARNTTNRTETVRQLCIQTGVPASRVFTAGLQRNNQIEALFGGNPNLEEETSDTYTVGAVFRPSFIPRLAVTIDGYDIEVRDSISVLGGGLNNTLNLCFNVVQDINSQFCQAVRRDPRNGEIGGEFLPTILNANIGRIETRGVDLQVDYSQPLGFGLLGDSSKINFFFLGTYLDKFDVTPVQDQSDIVNECGGRFGLVCGDPRPEFKWTSRISIIDGPLTASFRWRHLGRTRDDDPDTDFVVEQINAYNLYDLSFAIDASDALSFAFGVNNLLDKKPPFVGDNGEQANTYPSTFDVLGRDYFVSASLRF